MKLKIAFLLTLILGACFVTGRQALASTADEIGPLIYKFHLYYDSGTLVLDKNYAFPYDYIADNFQDPKASFTGKVISMKGEVLSTFTYNLNVGSNQVLVPYFTDAQKVIFYSSGSSTNKLLEIDVASTSLCNQNNKCEVNLGEDVNNCPSDCKTITNVPIAKNVSTGWLLWFFNIMGVVVILIIIGAIFAYRKLRNKDKKTDGSEQ